jgi:hypothetical protein
MKRDSGMLGGKMESNPPYMLVSTRVFIDKIYMHSKYLNFFIMFFLFSTLEDKTKT